VAQQGASVLAARFELQTVLFASTRLAETVELAPQYAVVQCEHEQLDWQNSALGVVAQQSPLPTVPNAQLPSTTSTTSLLLPL
jgi:hypothetical protein